MLYGVIDIGSNSVRLLVAEVVEGELRSRRKAKNTTRLIEGMEGGFLAEAAMEATCAAVCGFAREAREAGCESMYCFGTAAMRRAKNAGMLVKRIQERCGLAVDIVSGEEEALLAYHGVGREGMVIDIGGGSTEFIRSEDGEVAEAVSLPLGAVVLMEAAKEASLEEIRARVREALADAQLSGASACCGIGGTVTTAAAVHLALEAYDGERVSGVTLTAEEVQAMLERMLATDVEARRKIPGLEPKRADIIPYGLLILAESMRQLGIERIDVSDSDNLEGYLRMRLREN